MDLYLVRHGESLSPTIDQEQSLSEKGKEEVQKMGMFLKTHPISIDLIVHSSKKRAEETAQLLILGMKKNIALVKKEGLNPNDPVAPIIDWINHENKEIMIVSHLPFLTKLASKLLVDEEKRPLISFGPSSVCFLSNREGFWQLYWCLSASMI